MARTPNSGRGVAGRPPSAEVPAATERASGGVAGACLRSGRPSRMRAALVVQACEYWPFNYIQGITYTVYIYMIHIYVYIYIYI